MKNKNIHLINLGILAAYMLLLTIGGSKGSVIITSIIPIVLQVFINLILFLVNAGKDKSLSHTYLLSAFLVLLIGFSSCLGLSNLG